MRKRLFPGHTMSADRGTWFQRIFGFSEVQIGVETAFLVSTFLYGQFLNID